MRACVEKRQREGGKVVVQGDNSPELKRLTKTITA